MIHGLSTDIDVELQPHEKEFASFVLAAVKASTDAILAEGMRQGISPTVVAMLWMNCCLLNAAIPPITQAYRRHELFDVDAFKKHAAAVAGFAEYNLAPELAATATKN